MNYKINKIRDSQWNLQITRGWALLFGVPWGGLASSAHQFEIPDHGLMYTEPKGVAAALVAEVLVAMYLLKKVAPCKLTHRYLPRVLAVSCSPCRPLHGCPVQASEEARVPNLGMSIQAALMPLTAAYTDPVRQQPAKLSLRSMG